jgi:DNA-binding MarR family transcriptional regulator
MGSHSSLGRAVAGRGALVPLEVDQTRVVLDGIRRIVQALRASSRAAERRVGLSGAQLFVLLKLSGEEALSINDLAARTLTHQSSVSVVVARLVQKGLVSRQRSSSDARRVQLSLTRRGRTILARAPQAAQEQLIAAVASLPAAERRSLARSLDRLAGALAADAAPPMLFEEEHEPAAEKRRGRAR